MLHSMTPTFRLNTLKYPVPSYKEVSQDFLAMSVIEPSKILRSTMVSVPGWKRTSIPEFTMDKAFSCHSACLKTEIGSS